MHNTSPGWWNWGPVFGVRMCMYVIMALGGEGRAVGGIWHGLVGPITKPIHYLSAKFIGRFGN